MKTNISRFKLTLTISFGFFVIAGIIGLAVSAASIPTFLGIGTNPNSELQRGPATLTARGLLITPETPPADNAGWHYHPGIILSVVGNNGSTNPNRSELNRGSITIEDGCGGEQTYSPGQAFEQIGGRVHRAKNLSGETVEEHNMFINPQGTPITRNLTERQCGPPLNVDECKNEGWAKFNFPLTFENQGSCMLYVRRRPKTTLSVPLDPLVYIPE